MILLVTEDRNEGFIEALSLLDSVCLVAIATIPSSYLLEIAVREELLENTFTLAVVAVRGECGICLCKAIKEMVSAPPIIYISEDEGYEHRAEKIGVEDFWVQPMPAKLLQKQAAYFLREKKV